ncbi:MAG: HDOD domain-containing protein, partial [Planctomycetes bacterium]|nr:HDOD domain-containing protein [Planctomycetota bacterium]
KHSIGCGAAARALGRRLGQQNLEELFVAGLLHDIGKLLEDQYLHDQFIQALTLARDRDCLLSQTEAAVFGVTHADVGGLLLGKWNLSKGLVEVVRCHHNPSVAPEGTRLATAIVHFADILARALRVGSGGDRKIPIISDVAWTQLGLTIEQLDDVVTDVGEEIDRAMFFLDFIR